VEESNNTEDAYEDTLAEKREGGKGCKRERKSAIKFSKSKGRVLPLKKGGRIIESRGNSAR